MLAIIVAAVLLLGIAIIVAFRAEVPRVRHQYRARRFDAVYERNRLRAGRR
jgi:hypothetical protein